MIADGTATGCKRSCRALNELATRCYSLMSTELAAVVCDEPSAISLASVLSHKFASLASRQSRISVPCLLKVQRWSIRWRGILHP